MKKISKLTSVILVIIILSGVVSFSATGYKECFSSSEEFIDQSWNPIFDNIYVFVYDENCVYGEMPDLKLGALYRNDVVKREFTLLIDDNVSFCDLVEERIFYSVGKDIFSVDVFGGDKKLILTAADNISQFIANEELVFYVINEKMYRYHISSKTTDYVCETPDIEFFKVISNNEVNWWKMNPEWSIEYLETDTIPMYHFYYTSLMDSVVNRQVGAYEREAQTKKSDSLHGKYAAVYPFAVEASILKGFKYKTTAALASSYTINNVSIPLSNLQSGKYYNILDPNNPPSTVFATTSPCTYHANGVVTTRCASYNGSRQCAAFGMYIYNAIFGSLPSATTYNYNFTSSGAVASYLSARCAGAMIRVKNNGHSIIIAKVDISGQKVVIYDANSDNMCKIDLREISFATFSNYTNTNAYRSVSHQPISQGSAGHRICKEPNCAYYIFDPHHGSPCIICGY